MAFPVSSGAYSWAVNASSQNTASTIFSLISACGLIAVYSLLNLINFDETFTQRDIVDNYLIRNIGNVTQHEISYCAFLLATLPKTTHYQPRETFAAMINLIISFGLGLMTLVVLSAIALMCYPRRMEAEELTFEQRRASTGYRLLTLGFMLRRYHVRLNSDDSCDIAEAGHDGQVQGWMIPKPGIANDVAKKIGASAAAKACRVLSDKCPICLESYKVGEKVAYSSNPSCVHAFHESCILSWMLPQASGSQQCPCCRQTFLCLQDCPEVTKKVY